MSQIIEPIGAHWTFVTKSHCFILLHNLTRHWLEYLFIVSLVWNMREADNCEVSKRWYICLQVTTYYLSGLASINNAHQGSIQTYLLLQGVWILPCIGDLCVYACNPSLQTCLIKHLYAFTVQTNYTFYQRLGKGEKQPQKLISHKPLFIGQQNWESSSLEMSETLNDVI